MTFQPIIPSGGLVGWRFLERSYETQSEAFSRSPAIRNEAEYFRSKIGGISTAAQLVDDRRLLSVALSAFGLEADIDNRYFVRRVLEDGTNRPDALANRLSDARYRTFAAAFGFGDLGGPKTTLEGFAENVLARYERKEFEQAVGEQDNSLRLALNADSAIAEIAAAKASEETKWFRVMGSTPLRQVFEGALGLPPSFARIDLDRQLEMFRDKAERAFGTGDLADFGDPDLRDRVIQRFLLRSQISEVTQVPGQTALSLLQGLAG